MNQVRLLFYLSLAVLVPGFFLLHWNGLFAGTHYWALVWIDGTHSLIPQLAFSLLAAVFLFGIVILLFEVTLRRIQRLHQT